MIIKISHNTFAASVIMAVAALCMSCSRVNTDPGVEFTSVVNAYTGGIIGEEDDIRIKFAAGHQGRINTDGIFKFHPSVKGEAVQTASDAIVFVPGEGSMKPGKQYSCTVDLEKAIGITDPKLSKFNFVFTVRNKEAAVSADEMVISEDGLTAGIRGRVSLSCNSNEETVRKMIQPGVKFKNLDVTMEDERNFSYSIDGIERAAKDFDVVIALKSAEFKKTGKCEVTVPGTGSMFRILGVTSTTGKGACVQITFSQPLAEVSEDAFMLEGAGRYYVETGSNIVRLYHDNASGGKMELTVFDFVKDRDGNKLTEKWTSTVGNDVHAPSVSLDSDGNIVPDPANARITFTAVNLRAVDIRIIKIYEDNLLSFLQSGDLGRSGELRRAGRLVYKHRMALDGNPGLDLGKPNVFSADLSGLMSREPGAIYRVMLSFKKEYALCNDDEGMRYVSDDAITEEEDAVWDVPNPYYYHNIYDWNKYRWEDRDDPTKDSYYMDSSRFPEVDLLASDMAMIAKYAGGDKMWVAVSDIIEAKAAIKAELKVYDYQLRIIGRGRTDSEGLAEIALNGKPFAIVAEKDKSRCFLKLTDDNANNLSRFDVGGVTVTKGMKAFIYGERGVWRPGDTMYLTMILHDKDNKIPDSHPAVMELYTPQGSFYSRTMCEKAVDGFYTFSIPTKADDPTGFWNAYFKIGGTSFHKVLRLESIKPNRLKVNLDPGCRILEAGKKSRTSVTSSWLTGLPASGLASRASMTLSRGKASFEGFSGYVFDNPLSNFHSSEVQLFDTVLDKNGKAVAEVTMPAAADAPGMMSANIVCSVLENGGDSSYGTITMPFSPFSAYVGIKAPEEDELETDKDHVFKVAVVDKDGCRVKGHNLSYIIYRLDWSWWWETGGEKLSSYVNSSSAKIHASGTMVSGDTDATVTLRTDYPDWGRFLVYVRDNDSGHGSGIITTVDWPSYRGRARRSDPTALKMITLSTDKEEYRAGEIATAYIPAAEGRALVSIENASRVLRQIWITTSPEKETPYKFKVTGEMAPNFYIHVSSIQKYNAGNDLPIRRYGVKKVDVNSEKSRLEPEISAPESVNPQKPFRIGVREKNGRAMTYTLAIVDEGLLDLTSFKTPDPWNTMYAREALGVGTWDYYDKIIGSGTGPLLPMLGIGGDESILAGSKRDNRFNPVVKFIGPFTLASGKKAEHEITLPMYVGSVRVMVVAGRDGAFGNAQKRISVKSPLMILPSLPAVLGTGEKTVLPVSVFVMEKGIKDVTVTVSAEGALKIAGASSQNVRFESIDDKMTYFELETAGEGPAKIRVDASGNGHKASDTINIEVRNPNPPSTTVQHRLVGRGESTEFSWEGDNAVLELASFPSIDFNAGFSYFKYYPYSCTEQLAAKGISLVYSMDMLSKENAAEASTMIPEILGELYSRQNADGGFAAIQGAVASDPWVSSMAGQFMKAAADKGFSVDRIVAGRWKKFQKACINNYRKSASGNLDDLDQAYRLYTLALAGDADVASMNRLKESGGLNPQACDMLASAYALLGKTETAKGLNGLARTDLEYGFGMTYNSALRDKALAIEAAALCDNLQEALRLSEDVAKVFEEGYASTQERAFATVAMCRLAARLNNGALHVKAGDREIRSASANWSDTIGGSSVSIDNLSEGPIYAGITVTTTTAPGRKVEARSDGMTIKVSYIGADGQEADPGMLRQGTDFTATITVTNKSLHEDLEHVVLCQMIPSGWEIRNDRMEGMTESRNAYDYNDIRDDRNVWYFRLERGTSKTFKTRLRAAYRGEFVLPAIVCGPMYDAKTGAGTASGKTVVTE